MMATIPAVMAVSLPVRERGLKRGVAALRAALAVSLPVRERGLKRHCAGGLQHATVAPRAGAWIETFS